MKSLKLTLLLSGLAVVTLSFQNCSEMNFSSTDGGTLVSKLDLDPSDQDVIKDENEIQDETSNESEDESGDSEELKYICILAGPGKSVRLGFINQTLQANGQTPSTVCMSKDACLNIVSQKFVIQSAEARGFCPNKNPHVIPLSDEQIQAKIDEL